MELYEEMLIKQILKRIQNNQAWDEQLFSIIESECYQTLQRIQEIVADDSLDDVSCFKKIEQIVCEFEALGSSGGSRHDFS